MSVVRVESTDGAWQKHVEPLRWGYNETTSYFYVEEARSDGGKEVYMYPLANPQTRIHATMTKEEVQAQAPPK